MMQAGYISLFDSGELHKRAAKATKMLEACSLCPHNCDVNRLLGEAGVCGATEFAPIASYNAHFGEEAPLVGRNGSGTIFFEGCNLLCSFCQNYEISHMTDGPTNLARPEQLAAVMLELQQAGCHNINFVTPSHVVPQILSALVIAVEHGLTLPLVYNSGGYENKETLDLLDGIIDIYMPDFKFWNSSTAALYTKTKDYSEIAQNSLKEMFRQVGNLKINDENIAERGLLIRHLVMPGMVEESIRCLQFIAEDISANCHVNIMAQYHPCAKATKPINVKLSEKEYKEVILFADNTELIQLNEKSLFSMLQSLGITL